jgi:hypothetical protein
VRRIREHDRQVVAQEDVWAEADDLEIGDYRSFESKFSEPSIITTRPRRGCTLIGWEARWVWLLQLITMTNRLERGWTGS